jgi:polyisoprenoid-binding protein YceI
MRSRVFVAQDDKAARNQEGNMTVSSAQRITTWQLDPAHSSVEFAVKHMMMTTVRGRFKQFKATLHGDRDHAENAAVEGVIETASIDTGVADRDGHLRSADFFNSEAHPQITFRSTRVENPPKKEGDRFKVVGELTMHGTTMEVELDCEYLGRGADPWGKTRAGFSFRTEFNRQDWGLKWNQTMETGGVLVANKVKVEGEGQFVRDDDQ